MLLSCHWGAVSEMPLGSLRAGRWDVSLSSRRVLLQDSGERDESWHQSLWGQRSVFVLGFSEQLGEQDTRQKEKGTRQTVQHKSKPGKSVFFLCCLQGEWSTFTGEFSGCPSRALLDFHLPKKVHLTEWRGKPASRNPVGSTHPQSLFQGTPVVLFAL